MKTRIRVKQNAVSGWTTPLRIELRRFVFRFFKSFEMRFRLRSFWRDCTLNCGGTKPGTVGIVCSNDSMIVFAAVFLFLWTL